MKPGIARCCVTIAFFVTTAGVATASGVDERSTDGPPVIGVVHVSLESEFLYQDIQYQSFTDSFTKQFERLAAERGVALQQVDGGLAYGSVHSAVARILPRVDGLLLFQHDQSVISEVLRTTKSAPNAIVVHGIRPPGQSRVPYVGFDDYDSAYTLGRRLVETILAQNGPTAAPTIVILNNRSVESLRLRESGFEDGVRSELPAAQFLDRIPDDGTVESARSALEAYLQSGETIDVVFATSDFRARGAVLALEAHESDASPPIVAGVGGSVEAMRELLDPDSPWKAEVALSVARAAEVAFDTVLSLMESDGFESVAAETLVGSQIMVAPDPEEVRRYLLENHGIEDVTMTTTKGP